ncbi:hypothetical protein BWI17_17175 [Betaproteobacteria bacterium GR16-43]|nr:hypothetical protein BWI17_17175 [Betaproteobacteria bacterium GR16-43]
MPRSNSKAVIVVEDDVSVSHALVRVLRLGGLEPVAYPSAEAFLDEAGEFQAICLIIDIQLPGMSGFALRERLADSRALPPVVFMTAYDEPESRERAAAAGAVAFLAKPFSGRALLEIIEKEANLPPGELHKGTFE